MKAHADKKRTQGVSTVYPLRTQRLLQASRKIEVSKTSNTLASPISSSLKK